MSAKDETGIYFPVNRASDMAIPPVEAANVRRAGIAAVEYGERQGLSTADVVELLAMLRITRETVDNGLYATDAGQEGATHWPVAVHFGDAS